MYGVGIIVTSVLLASTQRQDPRRILRSRAMPSSHWLPTGPAGMTGISTLSGTSSGPFWFSSSFTLQHWLQSFEPPFFLRFLVVGGFWEVFLVSFAWRWLFTLALALATWRKQERGREWHWFGEEGEGGQERQLQEKGCGQRRVMCQARPGQGVLWGGVNGKRSLGGLSWPWHFLGASVERRSSSFCPG